MCPNISNRSGPDIVGNGSGGNVVGNGDGDGSGVNVVGDGSGVLKTSLTIFFDDSTISDIVVDGEGDGSEVYVVGDGDGSGVNVIGDSSGVLKTTLTILLDVSSTSDVGVDGDGDGDGSGVVKLILLTSLTFLILSTTSGLYVVGVSGNTIRSSPLAPLLDVSTISDVGVEGGGDGSGVLNSTILTSLTTLILSTTSGLYVVVVSGNMAESSPPTPLGLLLRQFARRLIKKFLNCFSEQSDHRLLPFANGDMRNP